MFRSELQEVDISLESLSDDPANAAMDEAADDHHGEKMLLKSVFGVAWDTDFSKLLIERWGSQLHGRVLLFGDAFNNWCIA